MKKPIIIALIVLLSISGKAFADVDLTVGDIRLVINDYTGLTSLYRKTETEEFISVFDTNSFSSATAFYVLLDKKVYKLNENSSFTIESSFEENIATMICTLENKVSVIITWVLFSSDEEKNADSVRIAVEFANLDDVSHLIGFKAVFDTQLGESSGTHFTTALKDELNTEYDFTGMNQDLWIRTANDDVSMNFLLFGDEITAPQTVAVANKDVFSNLTWEPPLSVGRSFNSLQSYNNSALSATWQPVVLEPDSLEKIYFYASTAVGEDYPADINFIRNNSALEYFFDVDPELFESVAVPLLDLPVESVAVLVPEKPDNTNEMEILLAFIEGIIAELESNSSSVSAEEMIAISSEIDTILETIGW